MSDTQDISADDFDQQVLQAEGPVLVDFWAPWCAHCRALAPVVDELAAQYSGKLKVVKVNTDDYQDLAARFGIRGIPTLIIFKGGEPVDRIVGVQPKAALVDKLDKAIGRERKEAEV
jgi:thioredoxin 1